jgi:hypothetical protein
LIQKYQERLAQIASGPYKRPKEVAQLKSRIAKLQGEQGVAEGVRDLGYDAQSLIMKLRRDVEEKRLQPTPQAVLAAARELAGDMEFAPQLLVKQVLGQGVAEGFPKDPNAPKLVQDRKTGKQYDPNKEFEKKMNSPEVIAQMKRMAQKEGTTESGEKDRQWSNKDMERLRVATRDFDDIMASDGPDRTKQDLVKKRIQTKPMAGPKGVIPEQGAAKGYNPVEKDYEQWEQALYPHGNGASAFDLINGDETTIRNILTYVKQNRAVLGYEVSPETGRTVKDAIIDIRNEFPQLYRAAQQPQGVAENKKGVRAVKHTVKPRNPVAKNAMATVGGGAAGAHKDKKKAAKQGEVKHKNKEPAYESKLWAALGRRIIK